MHISLISLARGDLGDVLCELVRRFPFSRNAREAFVALLSASSSSTRCRWQLLRRSSSSSTSTYNTSQSMIVNINCSLVSLHSIQTLASGLASFLELLTMSMKLL